MKAKKPLSIQYTTSLTSIGDHLRKRRLDLGLLQREVALLMGSTECSIYLWETNRTSPTLPFLPKIIEFLGYCPVDPDDTPGRRLVWARRCNGFSQSRMAKAIGVDPNTLWRLEKGKWEGRKKYLRMAVGFLAAMAARRAGEDR